VPHSAISALLAVTTGDPVAKGRLDVDPRRFDAAGELDEDVEVVIGDQTGDVSREQVLGNSLPALGASRTATAHQFDRSGRGVKQRLTAIRVIQEFDEGTADVARTNDSDSNDRLAHL